ncbi:hypothetical protein GSI_11247 [Ganoderma sinense ZZ0214-1]|uniref:Cerato-platanin n=1 Tax=Ganoderma sinense ZZ0214-1 TaxID=1077348 RepID=A0A2G8RYS6_9APHY|nr:hypothetical protein GSI_11247 [Ganoderma sinense ZZ0214-1]
MPIHTVSRVLLAAGFTATALSAASQAGFAGGGHGPVVISRNISVSYDPVYDNGATPLSKVACSGGSNGLMAKGYTDFASIPTFPYIGSADIVEGYNSTRCGECWELKYEAPTVKDVIYLIVVDAAEKGWTISTPAMNDLTYGEGEELGRVNAVARLMPQSYCGM